MWMNYFALMNGLRSKHQLSKPAAAVNIELIPNVRLVESYETSGRRKTVFSSFLLFLATNWTRETGLIQADRWLSN